MSEIIFRSVNNQPKTPVAKGFFFFSYWLNLFVFEQSVVLEVMQDQGVKVKDI